MIGWLNFQQNCFWEKVGLVPNFSHWIYLWSTRYSLFFGIKYNPQSYRYCWDLIFFKKIKLKKKEEGRVAQFRSPPPPVRSQARPLMASATANKPHRSGVCGGIRSRASTRFSLSPLHSFLQGGGWTRLALADFWTVTAGAVNHMSSKAMVAEVLLLSPLISLEYPSESGGVLLSKKPFASYLGTGLKFSLTIQKFIYDQ